MVPRRCDEPRIRGSSPQTCESLSSAPRATNSSLRWTIETNRPLLLDEISLELQPQPTVYFEAKSSGTFVMRYGSKNATTPKYDLEAERDNLAAKRTSRAEFFGPVQEMNTPALASSSSVSSQARAHGSQVDAQQFSYSRAIVAAHGGMLSVRLDPAVLAHSHGLDDLRILDASSRQVPYIIEHEAEPLAVELSAPPMADKDRPRELGSRYSAYRLRLPLAGLP